MKKQISLLLVLCLGFTPFSSFAMSTAQLATYQAQINNQYLKSLEQMKQQELENIQRLRQQYQEQQRLLMSQFNQFSQDVSNQFAPDLGQASAAKAVSIRKELQQKKDAIAENYNEAMANLRETFNTQKKRLMDTYKDARDNAKKQKNVFLKSAKDNGQAAADAAVNGFSRFAISVGTQGIRAIEAGRSAFDAVRAGFNNKLVQAGLLSATVGSEVKAAAQRAGRSIRAGMGYAADRARAFGRGIRETALSVSDAVQTRLSNVQKWFNQGKDKLVNQIKQLNTDALKLKNMLTAAGTKPFNALEEAEVKRLLRNMALNIGALGAVGAAPVVAYHVGAREAFIQRMYEKAKRAVNTPIQKMTNSWRQFKGKMHCFGNRSCTVAQRQEAAKAYSKLLFTIYGLFVLAVYGPVIVAVVSDAMQEEQQRQQRPIPGGSGSYTPRTPTQRPTEYRTQVVDEIIEAPDIDEDLMPATRIDIDRGN